MILLAAEDADVTLPDARVVVAGDLPGADAGRVVAAVREAAPGTPVVALTDVPGADVVAPADLACAVERLVAADEYRDALADLYERARECAAGDDADVAEARRRADERFDDLRERGGTPFDYLLHEDDGGDAAVEGDREEDGE